MKLKHWAIEHVDRFLGPLVSQSDIVKLCWWCRLFKSKLWLFSYLFFVCRCLKVLVWSVWSNKTFLVGSLSLAKGWLFVVYSSSFTLRSFTHSVERRSQWCNFERYSGKDWWFSIYLWAFARFSIIGGHFEGCGIDPSGLAVDGKRYKSLPDPRIQSRTISKAHGWPLGWFLQRWRSITTGTSENAANWWYCYVFDCYHSHARNTDFHQIGGGSKLSRRSLIAKKVTSAAGSRRMFHRLEASYHVVIGAIVNYIILYHLPIQP